MSNVLSNALKQTQSGSVSVRVQALAGLADVTIADTGPGIAPDLASKLFEPFHQGPGAQGGTGLGLAISRQIARAMGGDLVLLPAQGQPGARFRLTFRLEPPSPEAPGAGVTPAEPEVFDLGGARVLVVDDIATNRLVAASMLKLCNTRTIEAANADEALALIAAEPVQAVLLDMNMPGVDGLECFRRICRDAARRGTARPAVVAMTADTTDAHRRIYLGAGLDGYVPKPLEAEVLARTLAQALFPGTQPAGSAG
jgi:CheY-like chemotaxis protein